VTDLVLGPMLRYVSETGAVFWVETDGPCEVSVLGHTDRTFHVEGHHYALVRVEDLEPGTRYEYDVELDGERAWPPRDSDFPPSAFRTLGADNDALDILFGSCRVAVPSEPPYTLRKDEDDRGREHDALRTLALRLHDKPPEELPELLLLLGDQVYADEVSPRTLEFIRGRRDTSQDPGEIALGFEEYTRLYRESWGEPVIRWLLSTVSSAMIFDDHDVHDDWNASDAWLEEMRATDWWEEHIVGALMSYWIYQHIGNLSPEEQEEDGLLAKVKEVDDAGPLLREFALGADRERGNSRWSYHRDLGRTRLLMIDSRAGRVLEPDRRDMLDDAEWRWIEEHASGDFDHLLIATSLPWLLAPAMHHLEAWNEAVCGGAWGGLAARLGEKLRQGIDLEHWAAFERGFNRLTTLQRTVGAGEHGEPPASIVTLSGDVHHAYLSEVAFPRDAGVRSAVYQAVCSPMRNPLDARERRTIKFMGTRVAHAIARALARAAGVGDPPIRWRSVAGGPWFENQVAALRIHGRRVDCSIQKARPDDEGNGVHLERVLQYRLA
jgi:PhoD-like phosphatase